VISQELNNLSDSPSSRKNGPLLRMVNISKNFGAVQALKNVDLELDHDEILGLVGDNAAGKSTLMKILAGVLRPDGGQIFFEDKLVHYKSPREARGLGIEMVYQDFALCKNMWIAGNIFMAREIIQGKLGKALKVLDKKQMMDKSQKILEKQKVSIGSCKNRAGELSGGQQQSVAIARALGFNARVVIMDEPTASLGVKQASRLLEIARTLPGKGISVVYITHRMQDIFTLCNRVIVLKTGEKVGDFRIQDVTIDEIVRLMILGKQENPPVTNTIFIRGRSDS